MSALEVGDWVTTTRAVASATDRALGDVGIRAGTKGVVTAVYGSRVDVTLDGGWGSYRKTLPRSALRVVARGAGEEAFGRRNSVLTKVRVGVAIVLLFPLANYLVFYYVHYGSFVGIVEDFSLAALFSIEEFVVTAIESPVQMAVYVLVLFVLGRIAFRR